MNPSPLSAPLVIGILADCSGSMRSSIGSSGTTAINRLESFGTALENLIRQAAASVRERSNHSDILDVRVFAYGFGFGNIISSFLGRDGPPVRDLFATNGIGERTLNVLELADSWDSYIANVRSMALEMFGNTPMKEAFELAKERLRIELTKTRGPSVLFVLSDGEPTDGSIDNIIPIVTDIKRTGTVVVSCFVTDTDITEPKRLYGQAQSSWPNAALLMFTCASSLKPDESYAIQLREYGWDLDPNARLFAQVNQSEMLSQFLSVVLSPLRDAKHLTDREKGDRRLLGPQTLSLSNQSISTASKLPDNSDHLVILVHGFNTFANWMDAVKGSLRTRGFAAEATGFGYFGFIRFLSFPACRDAAQKRLYDQIDLAITKYEREHGGFRPKKISFIAHSFGSWLVSKILLETQKLHTYRLILCGSVISEYFDFKSLYESGRLNK